MARWKENEVQQELIKKHSSPGTCESDKMSASSTEQC